MWNDLCRRPGLTRNAQAAVERGDEPDDGGHHGRLSNRLGLLRLIDCFTAGDRMEHDRDSDQFRERRRVSIFRPQSKAISTGEHARPATLSTRSSPGRLWERVANL